MNAVSDTRVDDIRIDASLLPLEYDVSLAPDFDSLLILGAVSARMEASPEADGTSTVHLHSKDQTLWEDSVVVVRDAAGAGQEETLTIAGGGRRSVAVSSDEAIYTA